MALDPRRVKALFHAALDLPDPADRPAFLDRECGDDLELRRRLEELLAAYDQPASALERPLARRPRAGAPSPTSRPAVDRPELGRPCRSPTASFRPRTRPGLAHRHASSPAGTSCSSRSAKGAWAPSGWPTRPQPVKRQVAVKLIKAGHGLADGPGPVRGRAAGPGPDGPPATSPRCSTPARPTTAARSSSWNWSRASRSPSTATSTSSSVPERLDLFMQICSAVQHAHQKGIIHRDLKPSNILVESHDGKPVPKVIDFGLAKATSGLQLTEHTLFTGFGSVVGTPLYMAPEQATFNAVDVDTRADVYALGVILYELLTGTHADRRGRRSRRRRSTRCCG